MPTSDELPETIKGLARRQAHEIRDVSWEFNVDQLIKTLASNRVEPLRHAEPSADPTPQPPVPDRGRGNTRKLAVFGGGAVVLVAAVVIVSNLLSTGARTGPNESVDESLDDRAAVVAQPPSEGPAAETETATPQTPASQPAATGVGEVREPVRQQRDPAAVYGPEIEAALERALEAEAIAFRELDPEYFIGIYDGEALDSLYSFMNILEMNDVHAAAQSYGRRFIALEVSPDGREARAEIVETISMEIHANMNDFCVTQIPRNDFHQTVYLSRIGADWIIYKVDAHSTPPDPIPC